MPTPSAEDIRITRQLIDAGRILNIRVLDHVIIGRPGHTSLREQGLVNFEA
jgi:DNA repair protein RadC